MTGWATATPTQRVQMLQAAENRQAALQNRPPAQVSVQYMAANRRGFFSRQNNTIVMNHDMVAYSQDPGLCLRNLYHEGRHAQQWDAVRHPEHHPEFSRETVRQWQHNMENYHSYNRDRVESQIQRASRDMTPQQTARLRRTAHKKTFESYYNQAIEKDARSYAQACLQRDAALAKSQGRQTSRTSQTGRTGPSASARGITAPGLSAGQGGRGISAGGRGASAGGRGASAGGHGASAGGHGASAGGHGASAGGHGASAGGHGASAGGHGR